MRETRAEWADAARHPIAWFSALLRGIDKRDQELIDHAVSRLAEHGFRIQLVERRSNHATGSTKGVAQ